MALLECLAIFIFMSFLVFRYKPLGMTPEVITNLHRLHEFLTTNLNRSGATFVITGPWFLSMDMLITTDPLNVHHILSKNFPNYPKGQAFRKMYDVFGDGIFNVDGHLWEFHRQIIISLLRQPNFQSVFEAIIWNKVEIGLLPMLESISETGMEIDLQDIFQRFTLDTISMLLLDYDPQSLSLDFPCVPGEKSLSDITEAILYRHLIPTVFWKLLQFLNMGNEKKLREASNDVDELVYKQLARIQDESGEHGRESVGVVPFLIREINNQNNLGVGDVNKYLRDTIVSLLGAGRDTTSTTLSWLFYLVAKNPMAEAKIRDEVHSLLEEEKADDRKWNSKDLGKLVYLHGALCEALRLYPPVPYNYKTPLQPEIFPSGHKVDQNTRIIIYNYGMGRMKNIWGDECMEFKPERWISKKGEIKHKPSYKFPAFSGGPRICLGKDMSFTQLKIVASTIIYRYHVELVEGHPVFPRASIILQMKHGLKVRLTKIHKVNI